MTMNLKTYISLAIVCFLSISCSAQEICKFNRSKSYPAGEFKFGKCTDQDRNPLRSYLEVDGQIVLARSYLSESESNSTQTIRIYRDDATIETGCPANFYLIDLSQQPVKVIAFGVKNACNEFHWASWGDKRSVIALKSNVKFTYENGKLTPPAAGEKLFKAIEPPHSSRGAGLTEESAIPFVNEVALPK